MSNTNTNSTVYVVGDNLPGYLPERDVQVCRTWADAKQALIDNLLNDQDYCDEDEAEEMAAAAEDVNLWNGPDTILVARMAYWVTERAEEDGDFEDEGPDTHAEAAEIRNG